MPEESKIKRNVEKMLEAAVKTARDEAAKTKIGEIDSVEKADKLVNNLNDRVESMRTEGDNIISRLQNGLISKDVAKKQMKNLFIETCGTMMGHVMQFKGVNPDLDNKEQAIDEAIARVTTQLS